MKSAFTCLLLFATSVLLATSILSCGNGKSPNTNLIADGLTFGGPGNDAAYSVRQTTDGGYIIAGKTNSFGAGSYDVYLIKLKANGALDWEKTYGGTDRDSALSVRQTADEGYIIAGGTYSYGAGYSDVYLIKTDINGAVEWQETLGGAGVDAADSVEQTADGGHIITGEADVWGTNGGDVYLIKTGSDGALGWEQTYDIGPKRDIGCSVQQTADGGYIIAGSSLNIPKMNYSSDDFLIKTDANGIIEWQNTYGSGVDNAYSVRQTTDGGYIVAGWTVPSGKDDLDAFLVKTDANGNVGWERTFGGPGNDAAYSVRQTTDGGYIIAGATNSFGAGSYDVYLIKLKANGALDWEKTYGKEDYEEGGSIEQTADGGYIIAGRKYPPLGSSEVYSDVYIVKTDADGNMQW